MEHSLAKSVGSCGGLPGLGRGIGRLGVVLLMVACTACGDGNGNEATPTLRGRAQLDVPVPSGELRLLDASGQPLQQQPVKLHNGTFQLALTPETGAAIEEGRLIRVELAITRNGVPATLAIDIQDFDLERDILGLDSVTTISAAYRDLHPGMAPEDALDNVWDYLGMPVGVADTCDVLQAAAGVDQLLAVSALSDFDGAVEELAADVDSDTPFPVQPLAVAGVPAKLFQFTAETLASGLFAGFTSKGFGFILSALDGPDRTQQSLDDIKEHLAENSRQLQQISAQVDALSTQIADFKNAITDLVNLRAYEQRASTLQKEINVLCSLQARLAWLALSDPDDEDEDGKRKRYAANLSDDIESDVDTILRNLESEMLGGMSFNGLISLWADINGQGTGYPRFFSNAYLKKAVPHADYFIGAQTMALFLLFEHGNYLGGSLGKNIAQSALNRWQSAVDRERRAIAANQSMHVRGVESFPSVILPSDEIVIPIQNYPESTRAFTRSLVCVPGDDLYADDPRRCTVHVLPSTRTAPTVIEFLATLEIGGTRGWGLPSSRHYSFLLADRPSGQDFRSYLNDNGFQVSAPAAGDFLPYFTTSDGSLGKLAIYPPDAMVAEPRSTTGAYSDFGRALAVKNVEPDWVYVPENP